MSKQHLESYRHFLKDSIRKTINFAQTDQSRGVEPPPIEKPFSADARRVNLVKDGKWTTIPACDLIEAIRNRRSRRAYRREALTLEELSFLLWATQGIRQRIDAGHAYRTVPSAGCRHALETYLCVLSVDGLEPAIYRYLPLEHQLLFEFTEDRLAHKMVAATFGQSYPGQAAVTFTSGQPFPTEWSGDITSRPTRSSPSMPAMSVRTFIWLVRPSGLGHAPSPLMIRRPWTGFSGSMGRMSSPSTSHRWGKQRSQAGEIRLRF